jgi:hypothetical protein
VRIAGLTTVFVIATKFDPNRPVIYECVESIQKHHSDARILIVDSDSPDKSYFSWATERGCNVADIKNHGYAHGAFRSGIRAYPNESFYYLMFDSLIVNANLDDLRDRPVTAIRHWSNREHDWGWDRNGDHLSIWGNRQLHRMGVSFPTEYHGIMGPVMFLQRRVVDRLDGIRYWDTQIHDAYENCGLERVAGICLEALDYSVTDSLQGVHINHDSHYPEDVVRKIDMARA